MKSRSEAWDIGRSVIPRKSLPTIARALLLASAALACSYLALVDDAAARRPNMVQPSNLATARLAVSTGIDSGRIQPRTGGGFNFRLYTRSGKVAARSTRSACTTGS